MKKEKKTIDQLIDAAKEKKSTTLYLGGIDGNSNELPDKLYELTDLKELTLGPEYTLSQIPNKIHLLKNLETLSLQGWELIEFPLELMQMESLKQLSIVSSNLTKIPKELNGWTNLEYLNIGQCDKVSALKGLPPNLDYIYINGSCFKKFPDKIFELKKLKKIVAQHFNLVEVPIDLCNLENLYSLFLGYNKLTSLPNEILNLTQLRELWLEENSFEEFPDIVTQIPTLEAINLPANYLSTVSKDISYLKHLKTFNLGRNNFTVIPEQLFDLQSLTRLDFHNSRMYGEHNPYNQIKNIPDGILKLEKLKNFDISDNPIENVPLEIVNGGIEAIKNFLLSKVESDNEDFLYEAKMVVVGRGDVGKTVLTKKLSLESYSLSKSKSTKGISILKSPFEFTMEGLQNKGAFRFNIWDFGGQEKYDATHQLFITNRSIYLFLTEARDESNYQDVFYWLNTISLFGYDSPVIIILSKFDERKKILPESIYRDKFKNIVQFVDVSCANGYEYTIENLKIAIKEAVKLLPQTKLTLSNHWINIREELEQLSRHTDHIDYTEYLEICKVNKLDNIRADFLSEYLNDLGVIIHHKHNLLLRNTVFLNTDWCVDGMYKVLDDEGVFKNKGKFSNEDLTKIWNEKRFRDKQAELLQLMRDYSLCFELADQTGYIAPDLLPPDRPDNFIWELKSTLQFEYQYTFMPAGMVSRFIVKSHGFIKENLYWKYGVVLKFDNTEALVEEDYINSKIKISLIGENKKGLLSAIKMFIEEVHKDFDRSNKLVFQEMVPCNCPSCNKNTAPHFYKFLTLRKFEQKSILEIPCDNSGEMVKIKSLINDVIISNPLDYFESDNDLKNFILDLLDKVLLPEIELKGGHYNFWRDKKLNNPKDETEIQPYICNVLDNYCKVKGINLAREVKEANGSVDILFSCSNKENNLLKVCVEIKKAHHSEVETALNLQLPNYMKSAGTQSGIYLVVWFKNNHFLEPSKFKTKKELETVLFNNNLDKDNISIKVISCEKSVAPSRIK